MKPTGSLPLSRFEFKNIRVQVQVYGSISCPISQPLSRMISQRVVVNVTFFLQCDPPDNAVPQGEQPLPNADHAPGGDHPVTQHSGEHRQFHCRYKERPLGLCPAGHRVPQVA